MISAKTFDCRVAFAETLMALAEADPRVVAVANDSIGSSNLKEFKRRFPGRLVNVGIAEQNMVGVSAGLALSGLLPFTCGASCFITGRALEQVKADLAYSQHNVKLCGMSSGMAYGELGPTHHSIEDLAWLRAIANLPIVVPADPVETEEVIRRLSGRRTCRGCGKIWHVEFDAPNREGVCDRCGGELFQRDDDKAETIAERLKVYARDTAPLVDFYGAQGKLVGIDATGPVEDITVRAIDALRSYGG